MVTMDNIGEFLAIQGTAGKPAPRIPLTAEG